MKIFPVSDLHVDQYQAAGDPHERLEFDFSAYWEADVVAVAGDVHSASRGPRWLAQAFPDKEVVYVAGNHEYYQGVFPTEIDNLKGESLGFPAVHFLENEEVEIDGVTFLGCTLWTNFGLWGPGTSTRAAEAAERHMPEYQNTRSLARNNRLLIPEETRKAHWVSLNYLASRFEAHSGRPIVVVTHHAPSPQSITKTFQGDAMSAAFASDLETLILKYQPALWIHGHTHSHCDYQIGQTRVVCNAVGYPEAKTQYDRDFLVEI